jgi:hypothetical protein
MNVDVEIYMSEFVRFFKENPDDLINLIGKAKQEDFFNGVRQLAEKNWEEGNDIQLTQKQMIALIVELNDKTEEIIVKVPMMVTKHGNIFLN